MHNQPYFSGFAPLPTGSDRWLMSDAQPHYLNPDADTLVICIHGFTGTTYEVYPAAQAIAQQGYAAVSPLLPGHGYKDLAEQKQQFARITKDGMLMAMRSEIRQARQKHQRVGLFGFSMGGAIALTMAAEGLVDAVAVAAPALQLPTRAEVLIPLLSGAKFFLDAPTQVDFPTSNYKFHHSRALRTLWQLARHGRKQLPKIQCPVFAVHSENDPTIPATVLPLMQQKIPTKIQTAWFNDSGHIMLRDVSGAEVAAAIAAFFTMEFGNTTAILN
ncbi:alpha/beta fold hydrolase [filamentous cyanobacterium LEGE 11480]|uniref:Alpha/beta fold hydrolase n=1 Tax=Romeriopsis navalis LEGE 11480 TaxID=2777977 RepID=A0A928VLT9_9CYAN|nr:alpha/beta fold hydrolase [Romeriopsis navalis]MBE9030690.1 alpha/beta fold hydrolase [Romeriopsis navalis LEGE 11480]